MSTPLPTQIRGGASYFRSIRSNLKTFVEFHGRPHLFLTFSVDESNNTDLKEYVSKFSGIETEQDDFLPTHVSNPFWATVMNYELIQGLLKFINTNGIDGIAVVHSFYRIEFQKRGSPHLHLLLWMSIKKQEELLSLITCKLPSLTENSNLHRLVTKYQVHKCSKSYYKKLSEKCRLNFPKPVYSENLFINDGNNNVLRRRPHRTMINAYNKKLLLFWCGNMDIQPISSDSYVSYLTKYVTKEEPEEVLKVSHTLGGYLKYRNYSVPEMLFYLLGYTITAFSTQVIKIGVSVDLLNKRVLKTVTSMTNDKDEGIFYANAVDKYCSRDIIKFPDFEKYKFV